MKKRMDFGQLMYFLNDRLAIAPDENFDWEVMAEKFAIASGKQIADIVSQFAKCKITYVGDDAWEAGEL